MSELNWVEMFSDEEEQSFNQSCKFGNLVYGHAVYCHCDKEGAPRKCRRTWYTGGDVKDEDCEYFKPRILK
jgi:hypothetical protein